MQSDCDFRLQILTMRYMARRARERTCPVCVVGMVLIFLLSIRMTLNKQGGLWACVCRRGRLTLSFVCYTATQVVPCLEVFQWEQANDQIGGNGGENIAYIQIIVFFIFQNRTQLSCFTLALPAGASSLQSALFRNTGILICNAVCICKPLTIFWEN